MRIIFPTNENNGYLSKMGAHFGKANFYTIITTNENEIIDVETIPNKGHSAGGCSNAVNNILNLNPDALVVVGIGPNPAMGFIKANLDVFVDRESQNIKESVEKLLNKQLPKISHQGTCGHKL